MLKNGWSLKGEEELMLETQSSVRITEVQAVRFRKTARDRFGKDLNCFNALVLIDGVDGNGNVFRGVGEAQFRDFGRGAQRKASWTFLSDVVSLLQGRTISTDSGDNALESIRDVMSSVHDSAAEREPKVEESEETKSRGLFSFLADLVQAAPDLGSPEEPEEEDDTDVDPKKVPRFAGVFFGLESALIDLASQALGTSVSGLLSEDNSEHTVPIFPLYPMYGRMYEEVVEELQPLLAEHERSQPLWLDFGQRLGDRTTRAWVRRFGKMINDGALDSAVMYRPLQRRIENQYPGIIKSLAKAPRGESSVIVTHDARWLEEAGELQSYGSHAYVSINPSAVGGLLKAEEIARSTTNPVVLVDNQASGPAALYALVQLAIAVPNVRAVVSPASNDLVAPSSTAELGKQLEWLLTAEAVRYASTVPQAQYDGMKFNLYDELPYLQELGPNGTKGHLMEREALSLGMDTVRYSKGAFIASDGEHEPLVFKWSRSPLSSAVALSICTHKEATRMRLGQAGIPVPRGRTFRNGDTETAKQFADLIGFPVVVKPAMGVRGIGVVAGIQNQEELDLALEQLQESKLGSQDFIVEKHVHGKDYRIVVVGDEVVAAILREPASVRGDGYHTITELVLKKNAQRRLNPHLWGRPIVYDAAAEYQLGRLDLTADSVLEDGDLVMLSNSSSLSQGGESFDVLDELHPTIKESCVAAVKAIPDLAFCGVDFLMEDHTKPLTEQEAGVCELNAHAAIGNCEYPLYGEPRKVAHTFMNLCVERRGLNVNPERAKQITVRIRVRGRVTGVGYRRWMKRLATEYGISGWIRNTGPRTATAVLSGETKAVTALVASAVLGPRRAKPTSVTTTHVPDINKTGFEIIDSNAKENSLA